MSASAAIRQFLFEAQQRVPCHALAFTPPSRDHFDFHCSAADAAEVRQLIENVADSFLLECRNRPEPLVSNKVRFEANGPLLGRFLAVAIHDDKAELAGVALIFRTMEQTAFSKEDARAIGQLAHQLSKIISQPADPMTGLLTRNGVEKLIEWRLGSRGARTVSTVLYGDIDQLHVVNDLLGFEAGDQVIAAVAHALQEQLASRDAVLSRLSGDRFTIFFADCPLDRARAIGDELRDAVSAVPLSIGTDSIPLSISFGAANVRGGERSFDHALAAAEVACKAAKDRGRNRVESYEVHDSSINRRIDDIAIVGRLRVALEKGNFQIFGQPIAPLLQPESVRRYEMLLRLIDEKGRLVLPGQFMSSATRYQLLPTLDRCVISHVLTKLAGAKREPGFEPMHLSINLSGPTLSDPTFLDWLVVQIDSSGVPGQWLEFELTETAAVSNLEHAQRLMARLTECGCRFALDDFGTGLSSLAHLKALHFSVLKIDGSFIRDILHNDRSDSLVRAVAQLAHGMGMETVAEYVETPEICMRLIELGVQFGQGYAIGKPRPLDRILQPDLQLANAS
ncbi:MAG TPA: bifunctional diguanylate cyclase/phosphodiesterase [Steroidobacteraceae bacterium]|nr:bifunctional diguanylate cyclase/phosphodiesterase [Steroidobacteraceae bacterium]